MSHEPAAPGQRDPLVGALVAGKYRMVALIGRGGGGRVYKGIQEPLGRYVAVKVLGPLTDDSFDPDMQVRRFLREATVTSQLTHPNTIVVHDYGALPTELAGGHSGGLYLVMEYLEGLTLRQLLTKEAPLPPGRAVHIAWQIGASLAEAHEHGVVHRDLKPPNVMMVRRGNDPDYVKVLDFGLVKSLMADDHDTTRERSLLGSPHYMAPEQAVGEPVDARSDIYSFGSTLYELLVGRAPFRKGNEKELSQVLRAVLTEPPPPFAAVRPDLPIPAELEALTMRCLAKRPDDRPSTMMEVLDELAAVAAALPPTVTGRRSPISRAAESSAAALDAVTPSVGRTLDPVPSLVRRAPERSRVGLWTAALLLGAGAVAAIVWLALRRPVQNTPPVDGSNGGAVAAASAQDDSATPSAVPVVSSQQASPLPASAPEAPAAAVHGAPQVPVRPQVPLRVPQEPSSAQRRTVATARAPFPTVALVIESVPDGVSVYDGERLLGTTRLELALSRARLGELALVLRAKGYDDAVLSTQPSAADSVTLRATLDPAPTPPPGAAKRPTRPHVSKPPMDIKLTR